MNNTEFAELLLTRIYDLAEKNGHHTVVNFIDEAKKFGITDQGKVENIADYLKNRGLIDASFTVDGPRGFITGSGAIFVEKGGDTGIISKYRNAPNSYIVNIDNRTTIHGNISNSNLSLNSNNVNQNISISSEVDGLIHKMIETLKNDSTLSKEVIEDALNDIESLKAQLNKKNKNNVVVESILTVLSNISSIGSFALQLAPLIFKL